MAILVKDIISKYINSKTEDEICEILETSEDYGEFFCAIKNLTTKIKYTIIKRNPNYISHIKNPSIELQKMAVKHNPYTLKNIKKPNNEVQLLAIKQTHFGNMYSLLYNIDYRLCLEAQLHILNKCPGLFYLIRRPYTQSIIKYLKLLKHKPELYYSEAQHIFKYATLKTKTKIIKQFPNSIAFLTKPHEELQQIVINYDMDLLGCIDKPTKNIQLQCIKKNPEYLLKIKQPYAIVQLEAVKNIPYDKLHIVKNHIKSPIAKKILKQRISIYHVLMS